MEQGWRVFLVKVHNEAGVTAPLRCSEPQRRAAARHAATAARAAKRRSRPRDVRDRWLDVEPVRQASRWTSGSRA